MQQDFQQVAVSLLILMALLVPLDFLLGIVLNSEPDLVVDRSVVLREWAPNQDSVQYPRPKNFEKYPHLDPDGYRVRTDDNGFIVGPEGAAKTSDVIFIGASTMECLYVDEDKRFPYLVGKALVHTADGSPVGALNSGFSGNHTLHTLIDLIARVIPLRPKIVVVMLNGNDLQLLTHTGSYFRSPKSRAFYQFSEVPVMGGPFAYRLRGAMRSGMTLLYPNILHWGDYYLKKATNKLDRDEWEEFRSSRKARQFAEIERSYRSALESVVSVARAWGIEVVLMTEFNRIRLDDEKIRADFEEYAGEGMYARYVQRYATFNDIVRELAVKHNLILIDLDRRVPAEERYIYDPLHLTTAGSELVAEIIAERLAESYEFLSLQQPQALPRG